MSSFELAIDTVLEHEGYLSNDRADPGGVTKYGVSLRFLQSVGEDLGDIDRDGDIDEKDVRALPLPQAKEIYRSLWWDRLKYGTIVDQRLATKVLDLSVNMGPKQAHKLLQKAVNRGSKESLTVDGTLGPKTFLAVNLFDSLPLLKLLADEAALFYIDLTFSRIKTMGLKAGGKYLKGWIRRAYALT